jgi:NAD(P) transhydrogenase subunit beta
MQTMISHFSVTATDLMVTSLGMSGLAMLVPLLVTALFIASMSMAGVSLVMSAGRVLVGFLLSKIWMVSLLSMLALYNGIGGGAASATATAEVFANKIGGATARVEALIVALIGAVSVSGSLIAWIKINGLIREPSRIWRRQALSLVVIVLAVAGYVALTVRSGADRSISAPELVYWLVGCALLFGALITLRFRKAQMPILISLYNALTGLAIGLEGLILQNQALLIVGIAIGTARVLITVMMVEHWPEYRPWHVLWSTSPRQRNG